MKKDDVNYVYGLIAVAFACIIIVDTILRIHPWGNLVGAALLLVACYQIGRKVKK